ncbi:MAG: iron reductase [Merismopedia sp. SIO2A8]|nr:iron reductase [Merismopedia sp. SIO2A8]
MQRTSWLFLVVFLFIFFSSSLLLSHWHIAPIENVLGLLSVISYVLTLMPSLVRTLVPKSKRHPLVIGLIRYRRQVGVASFCFGSQHGLIIVGQRSLNMLSVQTYYQYLHGSILLGIFLLLTLTSNDESLKWLKIAWKRLHQVTYVIPLIVLWHVVDNMNSKTWVTPIAETLTLSVIVLLTLRLGFVTLKKWGDSVEKRS